MRMYVVDGSMEFNRVEFEEYLISLIHENKLYNLTGLLGSGEIGVEHYVKAWPFRLAKEIFGKDRVVTFR